MGRVREYIQINGQRCWTLFDTGARNTYVTKKVARSLTKAKLEKPLRSALGGSTKVAREFAIFEAKIQGHPIATHAMVIDQIGDDDDVPQADLRRGRSGEGPQVEPVRHDGDLSARHALELEAPRGGTRVRNDSMRERVRRPLHRNLCRCLVGVDFAPVRNPDRNTGQRGGWQTEDVRVELGRVHDGDPAGAAPSGELPCVAQGQRRAKASDGKLGNRRSAFCGPPEPGPAGMKARNVHRPPIRIETPHHLDHLPLRAARLKAGHHHGNGHAAGFQLAHRISKRHAPI